MKDMKHLVETNHIGWEAIQHKDGWWVGTENGVTCYGDRQLAKAALTIITRREGAYRFRIATFTGADVRTGEHTPPKSAEQAMRGW